MSISKQFVRNELEDIVMELHLMLQQHKSDTAALQWLQSDADWMIARVHMLEAHSALLSAIAALER